MSDLVELRASATPLAFRCGGSVRSAKIAIRETNDAANVGTAAHEALRSLAETGSLDWEAIPEIAAKYDADADEVRVLCAIASKLWPKVAESFQGALTEVELGAEVAGVTLTGHVDLLSITDTVARGADWKTGRKDSDYSHQMRAYGALILLDDPTLTEVTITVIWVRDEEIENYTMTRADAERWIAELVRTVINWDGVYRPGRHCAYCPRSHECAAANALVRRDVAAVSDRELVARVECELELMSPSEIVEVLAKADLVVKYAERVREAVKAHVDKHGDIVADGVRLTIDTEKRREVDPVKAWPVLEAVGFGDEDFAHVMDLRISRVEKLIATKAGKGKGAGAVRKVTAELEAAEAFGSKEVRKLVVKRA